MLYDPTCGSLARARLRSTSCKPRDLSLLAMFPPSPEGKFVPLRGTILTVERDVLSSLVMTTTGSGATNCRSRSDPRRHDPAVRGPLRHSAATRPTRIPSTVRTGQANHDEWSTAISTSPWSTKTRRGPRPAVE